MNGLMWWIDRWRKSSAYMNMTLEEQGAYRNLLDEAQLRGGALPLDDRALAKASGDALRWRFLRRTVLARFDKRADGYHHETLDALMHQSLRHARNQRAYLARKSNGNGHMTGHKSVKKKVR